MSEQKYLRETPCGTICGTDCQWPGVAAYKGIRYATAERWAYPEAVTHWDGVYDATAYGACCYQPRSFYNEAEMPEKAFYFFTQASVQRAMPAEDFATKAIFHGLSGTICDSVQEAVEKALARAGQDDIIFIGGSTFVVADALPLFLKRDK